MIVVIYPSIEYFLPLIYNINFTHKLTYMKILQYTKSKTATFNK